MPRRNLGIIEEQQQPASILRRSPRLHQKTQFKSQYPTPKNPNFVTESPLSASKKKYPIPKQKQPARKSTKLPAKRNPSKKASIRRSDSENSDAEIAKTGRSTDSTSIVLEKRVTRSSIKEKTIDESENPRRNRFGEESSSEGRCELGLANEFCKQFSSKLQKSEDRVEKSELDLGKIEEKEKKEVHVEKTTVGLKRKRNKTGENNGTVNGWSSKQEFTLQKAYLATKPTPHFWKKVAKLVPGKSAQECFNKIHSAHLTPPQVQPRTRARINSSSSLSLSLSPSDLFKSPVLNVKNKRKSVISHKNVRQLLHKSYKVDQNYETDLFAALESTSNPPVVIYTPDKKLQSPQSLLKTCQKKEMSRFSKEGLVSPPVLKQVKNRVMHDRYIDRLRTREAKRKTVFLRSAKDSKKEDKIDVVKAAKNALVSEAGDVINQLRNVQVDAMNSEFLDEDEENDADCN